jgi:hemolysin activation/secretion protein
MRLHVGIHTALSLGLYLMLAADAYAQILPGPADIGRIKPDERLPVEDHSQDRQVTVPSIVLIAPTPNGADALHFTLEQVRIEGATAFTPDELRDIYASYLGKDTILETVYKIAGAITERYRNAGYFLSLAYVPNQRLKHGIVAIKVVEGYVGKVELPDEAANHVVRTYIERLTALRPVKSDEVESFLLRLNDLPGYSFRAVLSPLEGEEAAMKLTLVPTEKGGKGTITFDNFSSHYLGPGEFSASYAASLLPLQQTVVSGLSSVPVDRLRYGTIDHTVMLAPDVSLEVNGGVTKAWPGFTLKPLDIASVADSAGIALNYQWIRQREENLALKLKLDSQNVTTDTLDTPLTRDRIRALRANATYDMSDAWRGYNIASLTLSQGIDALGSSGKDDPFLSRPGAVPDFDKAELSLSRLQGITNDWSVYTAASGLWSPGVLYSSEQFGYGGQAFGRAYDTSEITGDRGIAGSLELRYAGWNAWQKVALQPYSFYDIGEVWNYAVGQPKRESGASAGFGLRFTTPWHESGNIGVAWPLTRQITAPIYGGSTGGPRILLQIGQEF